MTADLSDRLEDTGTQQTVDRGAHLPRIVPPPVTYRIVEKPYEGRHRRPLLTRAQVALLSALAVIAVAATAAGAHLIGGW